MEVLVLIGLTILLLFVLPDFSDTSGNASKPSVFGKILIGIRLVIFIGFVILGFLLIALIVGEGVIG